ncbi:hypothetical protein L6164_004985 [Bauhinia variegata]|uniref:Uncharacterized protein n=1 Tax=Bauhinia variegata TaxID=167791 RepID=A0ACB9PS05_BAUVA|nr:hypothetical protein L6164_004985 [Bauhinia variegata]
MFVISRASLNLPISMSNAVVTRIFSLPQSNFLLETGRTFAKGRKSKDEASVGTIEVPSDVGPTIKANAVSLMEAAMAALSTELNKLRTGRASPGMLDHIIVETA